MKKNIKNIIVKFKSIYYKHVSESKYPNILKRWYKKHTGEKLDFNNIQNFNQYIQYLKLYDDSPLKQTLIDKYEMRKYVSTKIGNQYLTKIYGVYSNINEVDFDKLPDNFVLKCNHGSGMNYIVENKHVIKKNMIKKIFKKWLKINFGYCPGLELQYRNIKPKIICEEYLGNDFIDLQVWCSKGKILFLSYVLNPHGDNLKATYDVNWNRLSFVTSLPELNEKVEKIKQLDEIVNIAKKISKDMNFLRLDFYVLNDGTIKISEFTFTPASGLVNWYPNSANEMIYEKIKGDENE